MTQLDYTFDRQLLLEREENIAEGRAEGIEEGRAQGIEEGRVEGRIEGELRALVHMIGKKIAKNKTIEEISEELEIEMKILVPIYDKVLKDGTDCDLKDILQGHE